jgi:hypothetical protein
MKHLRLQIALLAVCVGLSTPVPAQQSISGSIPAVRKRAAAPTASNFAYPQSIFVDSQNGNLWVTDFDNNRLMRFDVSALTGVESVPGKSRPQQFGLGQNYPNPFNPLTTIQFSIVNPQFTTLKVYDLLGREVATLVNELTSPGTYTVSFEASSLASGVYISRLTGGGFVQSRTMLLVR